MKNGKGKGIRARSHRPRRSAAQSGLSGFLPAIKGILISAVLTVLCMLLLALALKYGLLSEGAVPVINQVLKVLGIALAAFLSVRTACDHPWFRGMMAGFLYILLGLVVFSAAVGGYSFSGSNFLDLGMGAAVGALTAVIFGKKKKEGK